MITKAKGDGAKNLHGFDTVNAVSATVTTTQASRAGRRPVGRCGLPGPADQGRADRRPVAPTAASTPVRGRRHPGTGDLPDRPDQAAAGAGSAAGHEHRVHRPGTPQAQNIVDGTGVKVAFIADGVDINNPDFIRANGDHVFVDYQDFSGDGPDAPSGAAEAFGDASAIAAQGRQTYDLAN